MSKKFAFTTAELIIAIAVLGVLAVMLMPTLIYNTQSAVFKHSRKINTQKISQGITMLAMRNSRMNYDSNDAFVKDFQKYTKLLKRCSHDEIAKCWPYKITLHEGEDEFDMSSATESYLFEMGEHDPYGKPANYLSDNAAFVTVNGVPVIISYNKKCDPNVSDENKSCYVAIMDVNGEKAPNKLGRDVVLVNTSTFGGYTIKEYGSETVGSAGVPKYRLHLD